MLRNEIFLEAVKANRRIDRAPGHIVRQWKEQRYWKEDRMLNHKTLIMGHKHNALAVPEGQVETGLKKDIVTYKC